MHLSLTDPYAHKLSGPRPGLEAPTRRSQSHCSKPSFGVLSLELIPCTNAKEGLNNLFSRVIARRSELGMKTIVSATSRAKPISCGTIIGVVPKAEYHIEHLIDQLRIKLQRWLVDQQDV